MQRPPPDDEQDPWQGWTPPVWQARPAGPQFRGQLQPYSGPDPLMLAQQAQNAAMQQAATPGPAGSSFTTMTRGAPMDFDTMRLNLMTPPDGFFSDPNTKPVPPGGKPPLADDEAAAEAQRRAGGGGGGGGGGNGPGNRPGGNDIGHGPNWRGDGKDWTPPFTNADLRYKALQAPPSYKTSVQDTRGYAPAPLFRPRFDSVL